MPDHIKSDYVIQYIKDARYDSLKQSNRIKPWGTGHALLSASEKIRGPILVINSDDFYGRKSFRLAYEFLTNPNRRKSEYAVVAYRLKNTLSDFGTVSRAICTLNNKGKLERIIERKRI